MRIVPPIVPSLFCLTLLSCSKPSQPQTLRADPNKNDVDACSLLSSKEIESVQGEPVQKTNGSMKETGGFAVSQCYFALPTLANSINLSLTRKGKHANARDPIDFWQATFHREKESDAGREREHRGEEEENSVKPLLVSGVGDEAYWMGNGVNGALYALRGDSYLRIGIGGSGDQVTKIEKAKRLAQKAISRL